MSETGAVYAATHVTKYVEDDSHEHGCDPSSTRCIMSERVNHESDTLEGLLSTLRDEYFFDQEDMNRLFVGSAEEGDVTNHLPISRISISRLENAGCEKPSEDEMNEFRAGKLTLYVADYDFIVEKRVVSAIPLAELQALQGVTVEV